MHRKVPEKHRQFAKSLRANQTDAEAVLWQEIKAKRLGGFKFKRQVPLDGYILDFVCFEARLIIELDGHQHAFSTRDRIRDAHFHNAGFYILRFWNDEIIRNLTGACQDILVRLRAQGE